MITEFFKFMESIMPELINLFNKLVLDEQLLSEEEEKQIAMNLIRKAKDAQAKKEIEG